MKTLTDFIKKPEPNPIEKVTLPIITCSCGSRYSEKLKSCPQCGLVREDEEEIENWRKI